MARTRSGDEPIRDKERSKAQLVAAASRLFAEHGFAGMTVDEIATQAGVNKRLVYYYYGDKASLFLETVVRAYDEMARKAGAEMELGHRPQDVVMTAVRFLCSHPLVARLIDHDIVLHGVTARVEGSALYQALLKTVGDASTPHGRAALENLYVGTFQIARMQLLNSQRPGTGQALRFRLAADFVVGAAT